MFSALDRLARTLSRREFSGARSPLSSLLRGRPVRSYDLALSVRPPVLRAPAVIESLKSLSCSQKSVRRVDSRPRRPFDRSERMRTYSCSCQRRKEACPHSLTRATKSIRLCRRRGTLGRYLRGCSDSAETAFVPRIGAVFYTQQRQVQRCVILQHSPGFSWSLTEFDCRGGTLPARLSMLGSQTALCQ